MFTDIQEIKKFVNLSSQLDVKILSPYIEEALRVRIYPYIPKNVCDSLNAEPPYDLLKKAVANYAVAYSIPFLKVHLSNTGGNHFADDKLQKSAWWDLRDLGLSAVRVADRAMNDLLKILFSSEHKSSIKIFENQYFKSVWEFQSFYNIDISWEVFVKLFPVFESVWELMLSPRLGVCRWADFEAFVQIQQKLKAALVYFSLSETIRFGGVSFTENQLFIQWEELPWQQSKLLGRAELDTLYNDFLCRANAFLHQALTLIRNEKQNDPNAFLCFTENQQNREIITKKSGMYL